MVTRQARDEETLRMAREWARGTARAAILSLLEPGESYGYQILAQLRERGPRFLPATEAAVYPVLKDLEASGLLRGSWRATEPGVPPRKYYALTAAGAQRLVALRGAWKEYRKEIEGILGVR